MACWRKRTPPRQRFSSCFGFRLVPRASKKVNVARDGQHLAAYGCVQALKHTLMLVRIHRAVIVVEANGIAWQWSIRIRSPQEVAFRIPHIGYPARNVGGIVRAPPTPRSVHDVTGKPLIPSKGRICIGWIFDIFKKKKGVSQTKKEKGSVKHNVISSATLHSSFLHSSVYLISNGSH